jgi:hypothetical protein
MARPAVKPDIHIAHCLRGYQGRDGCASGFKVVHCF